MSKNYTSIDHLVKKHKKHNSQTISVTKEGQPATLSVEAKEAPDTYKMSKSETEPMAKDKEVEKYIETVDQEPEIHPELRKAGLQYIDTSKLSPLQNIQLPITDENVIAGLHKPINSSWRWLSEVAVYILSQAHIVLKIIHGKVVRVFKR